MKVGPDINPIALTIFGITGNLSQIKLLPALYHLLLLGLLPEKSVIIGVFRGEVKVDTLIQQTEIQLLRDHDEADAGVLEKLKNMIQPIQMDSTKAEDFFRLREKLDQLNHEHQTAFHNLFYLAIPPDIFKTVINCLGASGLNEQAERNGHVSRILVEKPFGNDLESSKDLITAMGQYFKEEQIFRIDHYLAKETAQNILAFRFNNPLIEGIWSRQFIDHIQITAAETIGIQGRVAFYENMGALRDIVQSHLLQLLALIMMENPLEPGSKGIHHEKLELLQSIRPITDKHVDEFSVRGQYDTYKTEVNNPTSKVETFAAVKLEVANFRWGGVPVLLRTGKALASRTTEIMLVFKDRTRRAIAANLLSILIQPNEGISFKLLAKKPGFNDNLEPVFMSFSYNSFDTKEPDAYQRVLVDAMRGDQSLFATSDEVIACWELLQPVLNYWQSSNEPPEVYPTGSWGPKAAEEMAANYGSEWMISELPPDSVKLNEAEE